MSKITLEDLTREALSEHIVVGASEYSSPEVIDVAHVTWKHLNNPNGVSVSVSLRCNSKKLIGRVFLQPRSYYSESGDIARGAMVTDLVIVPSERNAAALIGMTRMATKYQDRFDIVLHTSNEVSDVIYRKLFKFPVVFTMVASAIPLKIENLLFSRLPVGWLCSGMDILVSPWRWMLKGAAVLMGEGCGISFGKEPASDVIDSIHDDFKVYAGAHFERTRAYIDWRFGQGPIFEGKLLWVWSSKECLGYIAVRRVSIKGLDVLVILDSVLRRPINFLESIAIKLLSGREAIRSKCDMVFCLSNSNNNALRWWSRLPFIRIPDRYLPHPTPIFIHSKNGMSSTEVRSDLFMMLADLDYF